MKNIPLLIAVMLLYNYSVAQAIGAAEYFFDTDPGVGNGTSFTVTSNSGSLVQSLSIPTSGLTDGFHSLYVRSRTVDGVWSLYDRTIFLIRSFSSISQPLSAAEYFFDTDPGIGNGTSLALNSNTGGLTQTASIPTTGLSSGFHSFYIRTRNTEGSWSLYDRTIFFMASFASENEPVVAAEYFFDSDPGVGNGTSISLDAEAGNSNQAILLPTSDLASGVHTAYIRVRNQSGIWSLYDSRSFTISTDGIDNTVTLTDLTLTATFQNPDATYEWFDCVNNEIAGANATARTFTPLISGSYAVRITLGSETVISNCTEVTIPFNANDSDSDGILNDVDNCPSTFNPDQKDSNNNGIGDVCDNDNDSDGVPNAIDNCPATPSGAIVDVNGCQIFSLPADNFTVKTIGESCIASNNGSIEISTQNSQNYSATLTGNSGDITNTFTASTLFSNLSAGDYSICIAVTGQTDYTRCFDIVITEPEALSVSSKLSTTGKEVTLNLSGAKRYIVRLNDETFLTENSEITLPLTKVNNSLSVLTDKGCQGQYDENIVLLSNTLIYPNPVSSEPLTIVMGSIGVNQEIEASVYNTNGILVLSKRLKSGNGTISLDVSSLSAGVHLLNLRFGSNLLNYKIIKR
ncbi:thrombospondin type 3 repeat-containing protein [uncultured Kriegella sp.]|uniref:thrombospondin type 3 repeat-containing protein n=1 Tax=uncultured Kriegella sp. TaxID=1798910 RepID=UPI0030DC2CC4